MSTDQAIAFTIIWVSKVLVGKSLCVRGFRLSGLWPKSKGSVDKVPLVVIASDRRERGNLILYVAQRIEIAASSAAADSSQ